MKLTYTKYPQINKRNNMYVSDCLMQKIQNEWIFAGRRRINLKIKKERATNIFRCISSREIIKRVLFTCLFHIKTRDLHTNLNF
jgi:hypothetical protein